MKVASWGCFFRYEFTTREYITRTLFPSRNSYTRYIRPHSNAPKCIRKVLISNTLTKRRNQTPGRECMWCCHAKLITLGRSLIAFNVARATGVWNEYVRLIRSTNTVLLYYILNLKRRAKHERFESTRRRPSDREYVVHRNVSSIFRYVDAVKVCFGFDSSAWFRVCWMLWTKLWCGISIRWHQYFISATVVLGQSS